MEFQVEKVPDGLSFRCLKCQRTSVVGPESVQLFFYKFQPWFNHIELLCAGEDCEAWYMIFPQNVREFVSLSLPDAEDWIYDHAVKEDYPTDKVKRTFEQSRGIFELIPHALTSQELGQVAVWRRQLKGVEPSDIFPDN